ncbi:MAG: LexA family transcriptional regulator [Bacteroidota bacterium]
MANVNENIRYLRKNKGWTQEQFANEIGIKRSLVGAYEEGRADPRLSNLVEMSKVFDVQVDDLITKDLTTLNREELKAYQAKTTKVLAITVDSSERENIEIVPQKASAGYLNGYSDPQYIESLPRFHLPTLSPNTTYRAFEISGDSMLPLEPGTIIIGGYLEDLREIKNGKPYILLTKDEGIVYKRVFNYIEESNKLFLVSDNQSYSPYHVELENVIEVWEAKAYISTNFPESSENDKMSIEKLTEIVLDLQKEVIKLKN